MSVKHLYLLAVAALVGCAAAPGTPGAPATPRKQYLLTSAEIADAHADLNTAYDAVARLRPNWLAPHGAMSSNAEASDYAIVFVDGQQFGLVDSLRNLQAFHVGEIRYYNVAEAGARFGMRAGTAGAIEVTMKSP